MKRQTQITASETPGKNAVTAGPFGIALLMPLLLVLAIRLTMTESLSQSMSQVAANLSTQADPQAVHLPEVGPAVTVGLACVTFLLAGLAAMWSARRNPGRGGVAKLALIFIVLGVGFFSVIRAENRFTALVGLLDIGSALTAGWAVCFLCRAVGNPARRLVIAVLIAVLTIWIARGLYQRLVEFPDTIAFFEQNKEKALAAQGLHADDPAAKLYESRMKSNEVAGYLSLSNVMATGMVGLMAMLCGAIGAAAFWHEPPEETPTKKKSANNSPEISTVVVFLSCAGVLTLAGLAVTFLTASRGGSAMAVVAVIALAIGFWKRQWISVHRRRVLLAAAISFLAGMTAIIGYGLARDTLPSKSMMFRWHYWTGAAAMIVDHPTAGVGLNNFGDYYPIYKRPSSPEEVKDPHAFFVRIAAEMGIPAAIALTVLLAWMLACAASRAPTTPVKSLGTATGLLIAAAFCIAWWTAHQLIAEPPEVSILEFTAIAAVLAWVGFALAWMLTARLPTAAFRAITAAAVVGAFAMLAYDQINMALVTGPVAMLFWILLGLAASYTEPASPAARWPTAILGAALVAAALAAAFLIWIPILQHNMVWDPYPYELQAARQINAGNLPQAEASLNAAITRWPMSIDLQLQRMYLRRQLREPTAADIRRMLTLTHNARFYLRMGTEDSDLPASDRLKILQDAQSLNDALPSDEIMRLTPAEIAQIHQTIARLESQPH